MLTLKSKHIFQQVLESSRIYLLLPRAMEGIGGGRGRPARSSGREREGISPHAPAPHSESTHGEECFYPSILDPRENWHNRIPTWYRAWLKYQSQVVTIFHAISGRSGNQQQGQNSPNLGMEIYPTPLNVGSGLVLQGCS